MPLAQSRTRLLPASPSTSHGSIRGDPSWAGRWEIAWEQDRQAGRHLRSRHRFDLPQSGRDLLRSDSPEWRSPPGAGVPDNPATAFSQHVVPGTAAASSLDPVDPPPTSFGEPGDGMSRQPARTPHPTPTSNPRWGDVALLGDFGTSAHHGQVAGRGADGSGQGDSLVEGDESGSARGRDGQQVGVGDLFRAEQVVPVDAAGVH